MSNRSGGIFLKDVSCCVQCKIQFHDQKTINEKQTNTEPFSPNLTEAFIKRVQDMAYVSCTLFLFFISLPNGYKRGYTMEVYTTYTVKALLLGSIMSSAAHCFLRLVLWDDGFLLHKAKCSMV